MPSLSVDHVVVSEADGYVDIVVRLTDPGATDVSVQYATSAGTASSSTDYTHVPATTLTFTAGGPTTQTVRVFLTQNTTVEGYEQFFFVLSNAVGATIGNNVATVGIVDNDTVTATPGLFVRDVTVDEKAGTATFIVMLGGPGGQASNSDVTVDYSTANGTAVAGSDYEATNGSLTFSAGQTVKTVTVNITDDATAEGFERFGLNLSGASGATIVDGHADAVIGASDATAVAQPRISVSDMIVGESDAYVDVVVSLSAPGQNVVTVNYAMANDTAANGYDYDYYTGTLTFAAGETTKVVRIQLLDDTTAEPFETFFFNLSSPTNATLGKGYAQIGVVDDDTIATTPGLFVRDVTVDEKAGTASFVVMLGGPTGQAANSPVTVDYSTANGSATAGTDFVGTSGTLTFAAGETVKTVTVDLVDDATSEGSERFFLNLSSASGATIVDGQGVGVIGASDATAVAQPRISVTDMIVGESDGYVDIVVSLSAPGQNVVTVNFATANDTASNSYDYQYYNSTLTFAAGETTKVVRVQLTDDTTAEGFETFFFNLSSPTNAAIAKGFAQIGIVDDDTIVDTPGLFVRDVTVDEKAGTASFVVMLGGPTGQAANGAVTVDYTTANGSATAGTDFVGTSGTLTFAAGETVKTVTVDLVDDATSENFERFFLNLSGADGATIVDGQGVGIIGASDATAVAQPRISVTDMIVSESDGYVDIVVSLSAPGQNVVTVNFATANDTASNSYDYQYYYSTLTFAAGETTKVVRVQLTDDATAEGFETFFFNLSSPTNATIAKGFAQIGIVDDDTIVDTPGLFVRDVTVDEKAGTASFVVMLGGPTGQSSNSPVTVDYTTANGSATAGTDFVGTSGTLTFAAGETVKTVTVDLVDDATSEGFERFFLNLSGADGATIVDGQGVGIIGASDATAVSQPRISVTDMIVSESDGYVDIVVSLSAPGQSTVTVNFATSNDTASNSYDYQYYYSTLTFAAGETTKVVRVQLTDDATAEGFETFYFNLSSPTNATIAKEFAQIGIVDDDSVVDTPTLFVRDAIVDEKAGTATFVVALGGTAGQASNSNVTVNYATANGSATAGADYVANSGTLTFAAGETVKTVTVDLVDDALAEGTERFNLNLSGATNATIVDGRAVAIIGASDGTAATTPAISAGDIVVSEADGYAEVVLTLSAPSLAPVSVSYTMSNGTASNAYDYEYYYSVLTFAPGETTKTLRIQIDEDITTESLENFTVTLYSPVGATLGKPTATVGIVDNDSGVNVYSYGRGDDIYTVVASNDVIVENPDGGTDLVRSSVNYTLGANVENLTLTGSGAINGTGNTLANIILGNSGANTLRGDAGNDTLNGGAGADTMIGGAGNDNFTVDNAGDVITELAGGGTDSVSSNRTYTLVANAENLTLTGTAAISGTGNALNNIILGNSGANRLNGGSGNDTLNGGAGADTLLGGTGNDTFVVDNASDVVTEVAGAGIDTVQANRTFTLAVNLENLVLTGSAAINGTGNASNNAITGNSGNNLLTGGNGNDTLNGGLGADTLVGGAGNDLLVVDNAGDVVTELAGGGTDTVQSSRTYTLLANFENLTLTGSSAISGIGNTQDNLLTGNAGNNSLNGGVGNDTINGGLGADTMIGASGDDTFVVDNAGDVVTEAVGGGTDTVQSSRTYLLATNVENLTLIGTTAINGTGNAQNNLLVGNAAANVLNGGVGNDTMTGGAGNDTYVVSALGDVINEAVNGGTADTVQVALSYTLGANLERLVLSGTAAINGTGNTLDNLMTGNTAANTLNGGSGNDTLNGGAGNDTLVGGVGADSLTGGAGNDSFLFNSKVGVDTVGDFDTVTDRFLFSQATIRVGDGDNLVEGGQTVVGFGGHAASAEVVVVTNNLFGTLDAGAAASVIGSASSAYATGATRLFAVDNGTQTGIFLFTSSGADAQVTAGELTQIALVNGTITNLSDYVFTS